MKKVTIIFNTKYQALLIGLLLIVLAAILKDSFSININSKSASSPSNVTNPTQSINSTLETEENTEGPVSVTVTPLSLENGSPTWNFEIALNTHSGSIDADLVTVSKLVDDNGKSYKPVSWEGSPPGGHHRNGVLKFNPISPKPKFIELKIKDIGEVPERSFKWDL